MIPLAGSFSKLRIWCIVGLVLSVYAAYVELRAEQDASYVALCDVSSQISCTAVFSTVYGRGFGILQKALGTDLSWIPPNGVIGFLFYSLLLISTFCEKPWMDYVLLYLAVLSNLLSFYLAFLLYYVLQNFCIICVAIYFVNFNCLREMWYLHKTKQEKETLEKDAVTEKICENESTKKSN